MSLAFTKSVTLLPFVRHVGNRQHRRNFIKQTKTTILLNRGTNKIRGRWGRELTDHLPHKPSASVSATSRMGLQTTSNISRVETHTHFKTSDRTVTLGRHGSVLAAATSAQPQDKISYHHSNFDTHLTRILINAGQRRNNTVRQGQALPTTTNIGNQGTTSRVGRRMTRNIL